MNHLTKCEKRGNCFCAVKAILDIVSKKWTICIVSILDQNTPQRFTEIKNIIQDISPKALSDTLKVLEVEELITKRMFPEIPPRVEYTLTQKGVSLKKALEPLVEWAEKQKE
jgi:DNA-binding HxlR family transcriptional regulator